jgi:hypothetical protein
MKFTHFDKDGFGIGNEHDPELLTFDWITMVVVGVVILLGIAIALSI